jgi:hypothetical protein
LEPLIYILNDRIPMRTFTLRSLVFHKTCAFAQYLREDWTFN